MSCVVPAAPPDKAQLQSLAESLPELCFDPAANAQVQARPDVQAYLDFYRINFARELGVQQGLGALDVAGYRIAVQYWLPQHPQGTLVVVHGYYDHTGVFSRAIRFGLAQNLAVIMFDLPGHGLSGGERVTIHAFDEYANVLAEVLEYVKPHLPLPLYALGQSTGAATLLNYLWRYPEQASQLHRIALCAPLLLPRGWKLGRFVYAVVRLFSRRVKRGVSRSSHDPEFIYFLDHLDPLQEKSLSVIWVGAMRAWNRQFRRFTAKDTPPVLIIQGTGDLTVAWQYNLPILQQKLPNARIEFVPGAGHQLVNESDEYRNQVFEKIRRFIFG